MQNLAGFFEKFRGKVAGQVQNLAFIIEIIKKYTGIEVDMKNIAISSGILRLKISSVEKSQIFIKKSQILKEIHEKAKFLKIEDIG